MKKLLLNSMVFLLLLATHAFAQDRTITGTVTGADDGGALPGVSIKVKGLPKGSQTDASGKFSITVPSSAQFLTFSFVGYETKEVPIGKESKFTVVLAVSSKSLTEVVVVGYGTQERRDLTGSVAKVTGATIADLPTPSFDKDLAGRVTGVRVTESSGFLGTAPTIKIRGTNSISNDGGPLYVVDGIPIITGNQSGVVSNNPLADINSADIESIEFLKDGSATAIYGSRAASGVVLITTKKGKAGRQSVNYNTWQGVATTSKRLSTLDAADFITISNEKFYNAATPTNQTNGSYAKAFPTLDPNGVPYDTNWQNVVFQKGYQQNHNVSISGGAENSNYFYSGNYSALNGDIVGNTQTKYGFRANVEQKTGIFTVGFTSGISYVKNTGLNSGTNSLSGNVTNALLAFPNVPVFNPDGSYNISASGTVLGAGANTQQIDNNYTNIKYVLDHNLFNNQNMTINGTAYADAKIIDGLDIKSQIGINALYGEDYEYLDPGHGDGRPNGLVFQQYIPSFNYDWVNTLNYNKVILNDHKIGFVAGAEFQKQRDRSFYAEGTGLSNTYFGPNNLISSTLATPYIGGGETENSIRSFFTRLNYSYKDKYLLGLTYRYDYISNLGIMSAPAKLPGISVGWRLSDESFFKNATFLSFVNDLKLRASYGRTGNVNINNYAYASFYAPAVYGTQSAINFSTLGNPDLKFEETDKTDLGLDLSVLKNRLTLTADYFYNNDNGLIQGVATPPSLGVPGNTILENIGNITNKGFELSITSINVKMKDFSWTTGFNVTFVKNTVTNLYGGQDLIGTYNITRVGYSIGSFYGYQYLGVNPANGNPLYLKGNGQEIQGDVAKSAYYNYDPNNPLDESTANSLSAVTDKVILGDALPTYYGSINNSFSYKGIDLGIYLTFSGGNKVYDATRQEDLDNQYFNNNGTEILNRWTTPGQITDVPKLYYGNGNFINASGSAITRYLEDGKFLRAQEITLGYTLPKSVIDVVKLSKVRIYGQIQNAFILTHYKGLDPEVSNSGTSVDYNANPRPRTFVVGLNVGF